MSSIQVPYMAQPHMSSRQFNAMIMIVDEGETESSITTLINLD